MSNFTMSSNTLIMLWAIAGVLLVAYLARRNKRNKL